MLYSNERNVSDYLRSQLENDLTNRGICYCDSSSLELLEWSSASKVDSLDLITTKDYSLISTYDTLSSDTRTYMTVVDYNPSTFSVVSMADDGGYYLSLYTNQKDTYTTEYKLVNTFKFNIFTFGITDNTEYILKIGSYTYTSDCILFETEQDTDTEASFFITTASDQFIDNESMMYGYKYVSTIKISNVYFANMKTDGIATIYGELKKHTSDIIIEKIYLNDGYLHNETYYTSARIDFASSLDKLQQNDIFKSIAINVNGNLNETIYEYANCDVQYFKLVIEDSLKPIVFKNLKINYKVR